MIIMINAVLVVIAWMALAIYILANNARIKYLRDIDASIKKDWPSVAIVIPVRNEEEQLLEALTSLTALDYPDYKIIVVNDRSTDKSSIIIEQIKERSALVSVVDINELPANWIGKTHALYQGYRHADAEWLLFTDADVLFREDVLKKAISHCVASGADHLTVMPEIKSRSQLVNSVNSTFQLLMQLKYKPWAVSKPTSNAYYGLGAFNLVHRNAYEAIGTHAKIALHPNDDLKLGEVIKSAGFQQQVLFGNGIVRYEWYTSLKGFIDGLTKNAFSSNNYSVLKTIINAIGAFLFFVVPVPLLLFSNDLLFQLMAGCILLTQLMLLLLRKGSTSKWWYVFMIPFNALVLIYILLRSSFLALLNNGIYWSNCFYHLSELKRYK